MLPARAKPRNVNFAAVARSVATTTKATKARPFVSYDRDSQHLTAPQETEDDSEQLLMVGGGGGAV